MDEFITYGELTTEIDRPSTVEDIFSHKPATEELPEDLDELMGL